MAALPVPAGATTALVAVDQQRRIEAAVAALAPNTRKAYGVAWSGFPAHAGMDREHAEESEYPLLLRHFRGMDRE